MLSLSRLTRTTVLALALVSLTLPLRAADLDKLAPGDTEAVLVFNVKSLLDSALFKKYSEEKAKEAFKNPQAADLLKATGLDPLKDIHSITATFSNVTDKEGFKACVIVKGKLDVPKLKATIKSEAKKTGDKLKITTEDDQTYYTLGTPDGKEIVGTFVGDDALVISNKLDYLKDIVAGKKIAPTDSARALKKALAKVSADQTLLIAAAVTPELRDKVGTAFEGYKATVQNLDSATATFNVGESIDIAASINTSDANTAKGLGQNIKQAIPILKLLSAGNEMAVPMVELLVNNVKVSWEGKAIILRAQFTDDAMTDARERSEKAFLTVAPDRANAALKAKQWRRAEGIFTTLQRIDPNSEVAKKGLQKTKALKTGYAALAEKQWSDAETAFRDALKIDPKDTVAKEGLDLAKAKGK